MNTFEQIITMLQSNKKTALFVSLIFVHILAACSTDETDAKGQAGARAGITMHCAGDFFPSVKSIDHPINAFTNAMIARDVYGQQVDNSRSIEEVKKRYNFYSARRRDSDALHYGIFVKKELILISFRGTDPANANDIVANSDSALRAVTPIKGRASSGRVHKGYYDVMAVGAEKLIHEIYQANLADGKGGAKPIFINGHSLGAAMATLFAYELERHMALPLNEINGLAFGTKIRPEDTGKPLSEVLGYIDSVYGYGTPRVGDKIFKKEYAALGLHDKTLRFANINDVVADYAASDEFVEVGSSVLYENEKRVPDSKEKANAAKVWSGAVLQDHDVEKYISSTFYEAKAKCPNLVRK